MIRNVALSVIISQKTNSVNRSPAKTAPMAAPAQTSPAAFWNRSSTFRA